MNLPLITVVTPSYNQAAFVETTLRSVLGQAYPRLEYIVMDGGSTDGSAEIIARHAESLAFWTSAKDDGQAAAINSAMARATGDILCWLNSDDFFFPDTLHKVATALSPRCSEPALVYGGCLFFRDEAASARLVPATPFDRQRLSLNAYVVQPSAFWTRALWEKTGPLDASLHYAFDWDWFLRASAHCDFTPLRDTLSAYRKHAAHKSGSGDARRHDEILAVARRHAAPDQIAALEFAARHSAALTRRASRTRLLAKVALQLASRVAWLSMPRLWKLPEGVDAAHLESCRGMFS